MLSNSQLRRMVRTAPHFERVRRAYRRTNRADLSIWNPVLGSPNISCLREVNDYHRVLELVAKHEYSRGGKRYRRVIFTRLEYEWLGPHPPVELMDEAFVWLPYNTGRGLYDRHAVLNRSAADIYLGRCASS